MLNNSQIGDLGTTEAARLRAGGWQVVRVGGLTGRIRATTVYYPPGLEQPARALAAQFGLPRVLPRLPDLPAAGLVVVVTRDLRG